MTIEALAGDVVALLDRLGIDQADLFGFSLGGLVAYAVALGTPARVGKLIAASADAHRPPGRESAPPGDDRMPTPADFRAMRDAYGAVAPDPAHLDEFAAKTSAMVHGFPGWTDELRSLQVPTLLIFGDRDFSPLPDVVEMFELLPNAAASFDEQETLRHGLRQYLAFPGCSILRRSSPQSGVSGYRVPLAATRREPWPITESGWFLQSLRCGSDADSGWLAVRPFRTSADALSAVR
jgi:pimeloyl-ACP methyl ester carboxylesterase